MVKVPWKFELQRCSLSASTYALKFSLKVFFPKPQNSSGGINEVRDSFTSFLASFNSGMRGFLDQRKFVVLASLIEFD